MLCDRVAIIDHGKVIATGKPDELIANSQAAMRVTVKAARPWIQYAWALLPTVQHADAADGAALAILSKTSNISQTIITMW